MRINSQLLSVSLWIQKRPFETKCLQQCLLLLSLKYAIEELLTVLLSITSSAKYKLLFRFLSELKN